MTVFTNTQLTYATNGIREELSNLIYNISPTETPVLSNSGREDIGNTLCSWQTDALAAAAANAQLEGDNITNQTLVVAATTRLGNQCQISWKIPVVSGTDDAVVKAGRGEETGYQVAKRSLEVKRDMEFITLSLGVVNTGAAATARTLAGLPSWIRTNSEFGAGGAAAVAPTGTPVAVPAASLLDAGTRRALSETSLKNILQLTFTSGGNPGTILCGPLHKQQISAFGGIATKTVSVTGMNTAVIIGAADVYVSDFGNLSVVPDRFFRTSAGTVRELYALDWNLLAIAYLRPFFVKDLPFPGDARMKMAGAEWTLKVRNESGCAILGDLT